MGKRLKRIMLLVAVSFMFVGSLNVFASENPFIFVENPQHSVKIVSPEDDDTLLSTLEDATLLGCNVGIGAADNGLVMLFDTNASDEADEIGVKDITLYETKALGGWKEIPVPNLSKNNSTFYSGSVVYTGAVPGKNPFCKDYW